MIQSQYQSSADPSAIEREQPAPGGPGAAMVFGALGGLLHASLLSCPPIAATVTIITFLASVGSHDKGLFPGPWSIAIGVGAGAAVFIVLLLIYRNWYQSAADVYPGEYSELQTRLYVARSLL